MSLTVIGKNGRTYTRRFDHEEAKRRYAAGESIADLAREYGVHQNAVRKVAIESVRRAAEIAQERIAASGRCDRCGGSMNGLSRYHGSRLCCSCSADDRVTTVRPRELRCSVCRKWKPDDDFPSNRSESVRRRGRHGTCRPCDNRARQDYRERNRESQRVYDREYKRRKRAAAQPSTEDGGEPREETEQSVSQ